MIRIRFHGRGGQGMKTASRILGTAGFLAGYQVQDSPLYGAERRGAAVTAYTRIDRLPIHERGPIACPDLVVVADETLLGDPAAGVLAGTQAGSVVLLNSDHPEPLVARFQIAATVLAFDATARALSVLHKASAISSALAAAAARIVGGIDEANLLKAVRQELGESELPPAVLEGNVELARQAFAALHEVRMTEAPLASASAQQVCAVQPADPVAASPSILAPGNAELRHTGAWRVERPEIDYDRCTRCGLCLVDCPDGAITLNDQGYPVIDYEHCKGCMICRQVCPLEAIEGQREVRAW